MNCVDSIDALGNMDILMMLFFLSMNTVCASTCLYLLQFLSSVSYNFSEYRSFTSLVKFIARYFILFEAIVNRIVF